MKTITMTLALMLSLSTLFAGQFNKFSGKFDYHDKTKTLQSLSGTVEVSSIDTK